MRPTILLAALAACHHPDDATLEVDLAVLPALGGSETCVSGDPGCSAILGVERVQIRACVRNVTASGTDFPAPAAGLEVDGVPTADPVGALRREPSIEGSAEPCFVVEPKLAGAPTGDLSAHATLGHLAAQSEPIPVTAPTLALTLPAAAAAGSLVSVGASGGDRYAGSTWRLVAVVDGADLAATHDVTLDATGEARATWATDRGARTFEVRATLVAGGPATWSDALPLAPPGPLALGFADAPPGAVTDLRGEPARALYDFPECRELHLGVWDPTGAATTFAVTPALGRIDGASPATLVAPSGFASGIWRWNEGTATTTSFQVTAPGVSTSVGVSLASVVADAEVPAELFGPTSVEVGPEGAPELTVSGHVFAPVGARLGPDRPYDWVVTATADPQAALACDPAPAEALRCDPGRHRSGSRGACELTPTLAGPSDDGAVSLALAGVCFAGEVRVEVVGPRYGDDAACLGQRAVLWPGDGIDPLAVHTLRYVTP